MRVVLDTNVIIAYLVSGSSTSTSYRVCQRVINGNDKAFSCDILYGELNRLLSLDPDLIQKITSAGNKEGKFFSSLEKVNPQYLNARLDPLVTQLNFIKTESLSMDENALKDIGNDWYIISICIEEDRKYSRRMLLLTIVIAVATIVNVVLFLIRL